MCIYAGCCRYLQGRPPPPPQTLIKVARIRKTITPSILTCTIASCSHVLLKPYYICTFKTKLSTERQYQQPDVWYSINTVRRQHVQQTRLLCVTGERDTTVVLGATTPPPPPRHSGMSRKTNEYIPPNGRRNCSEARLF